MSTTDDAVPTLFDGIPNDATSFCTPQYPAASLALPSPRDAFIEIGQASQVVPNRNAIVVGRQASTCDIRITHKSLSRQHALLYYHHGSSFSSSSPRLLLFVYDLDTKSGTFVNHQRIATKTPISLKNGDFIQFGRAQPIFTIKWEGADDPRRGIQQDVIGSTNAVDPNNSQQQENDTPEKDPFQGLTGRERRQAEISAMMASLDETPAYTKYVLSKGEQSSVPFRDGNKDSNLNNLPQQQLMEKATTLIQKYHLPLEESTRMSVLSTSHVSSMVMDPTGARFAIGSMDSSLKLYDFAGFNALDPIPFQNVIIEDGYPIRSMAYSSMGDRLLIATGSSQPYVVDRDGKEIVQFVRGDVYVTDPSKTIGHTAAVTSVGWHPLEKSIVFSASRDGSFRCWNVDKGKLSFSMLACSDVVVIKSLKTGRKTIPTCMAVSSATIALGTGCGSLQVYKYPFVSKLRPQQSVQVTPSGSGDEDVLCVVYSVDASKIATRTKSNVTVWNASGKISSFTSPWMTCEEVPVEEIDSNNPTIDFSPNGKLLCVATCSQDQQSRAMANRLLFYLVPKEASAKPSCPLLTLPILNEYGANLNYPILALSWHVKLNQILLTTTKSFQIWYSTEWSKKGVLLTNGLRKKREVEDDLQELYAARAPPPGTAVREEHIITPNALPLFGGEQRKRKKKRGEEEHQEAMAKHIPQKPAKGVYDTANTMFTQMVMDNKTSSTIQIAGMDPREALAKYNEGKSFISKAYEGNVERILTDKTVEQEEEEMKKAPKK